jgi:putative ABC transport system substrate-binding protein
MPNHLEQGAVVTYTTDFFVIGKQAARLADQTLRGTKPANLPVETAETFLNINLKAAQAIGLDIPDSILRQADTIIR